MPRMNLYYKSNYIKHPMDDIAEFLSDTIDFSEYIKMQSANNTIYSAENPILKELKTFRNKHNLDLSDSELQEILKGVKNE